MKLTDKDTGSERQRHLPKITQSVGSRSPDLTAGQVQVLACLTISLSSGLGSFRWKRQQRKRRRGGGWFETDRHGETQKLSPGAWIHRWGERVTFGH